MRPAAALRFPAPARADAPRACRLPRRFRSTRRRNEKREAEARARELEELDRDTRTVFAYNVSTKADERDLFEFFTKAGKVLDVRIIYDRNTPRSKGMAYVEMASRDAVPAALGLTGQTLRGQVVMVKASEAEKNIAWEAEKAQKAAGLPPMNMMMGMHGMHGMPGMPGAPPGPGLDLLLAGSGPATLRVSGLHRNLTESDVRAVFEPFGALTSVAMAADAPGEADVSYGSAREALLAAQQLNGMDLAGSALKVVLAAGSAPPPPPPFSMPGMPGMPGFPPGVLPPGMMLPPGMALPGAAGAAAAAAGGAGELDEDGDGGLRLDSRSRAALMARLSGQDAAAAPAAINPMTGMPFVPGAAGAAAALPAALQPGAQGRLGPASPIPTDCILLKNMFDPATETEPDWWVDIGQDVKEECGKYGPVRHVFVDKDSEGHVYLRFATVAAASAARQALHTRWFASRMIAAEYQFTAVYQQHFPESAGA